MFLAGFTGQNIKQDSHHPQRIWNEEEESFWQENNKLPTGTLEVPRGPLSLIWPNYAALCRIPTNQTLKERPEQDQQVEVCCCWQHLVLVQLGAQLHLITHKHEESDALALGLLSTLQQCQEFL